MIQIVSRFSGFLELSLVADFLFLFMFFLFFLVPYCIQPVYLSMMLNSTLFILFGLVGLSPYIPATFFLGGVGWGVVLLACMLVFTWHCFSMQHVNLRIGAKLVGWYYSIYFKRISWVVKRQPSPHSRVIIWVYINGKSMLTYF